MSSSGSSSICPCMLLLGKCGQYRISNTHVCCESPTPTTTHSESLWGQFLLRQLVPKTHTFTTDFEAASFLQPLRRLQIKATSFFYFSNSDVETCEPPHQTHLLRSPISLVRHRLVARRLQRQPKAEWNYKGAPNPNTKTIYSSRYFYVCSAGEGAKPFAKTATKRKGGGIILK